MRLGLTLSIAAFSLTAFTFITGCSTGERPLAVDPSTDPAWQPPGQGDLAVADPAPEKEAKPKPKPRARQLQQPNHRNNDTLRLQAAK
jgi:hypothetical protein